jgi:hypothetical protein
MILSFPHSWLVTGFVTRVTWRVPRVEQELPTLPESILNCNKVTASTESGVHDISHWNLLTEFSQGRYVYLVVFLCRNCLPFRRACIQPQFLMGFALLNPFRVVYFRSCLSFFRLAITLSVTLRFLITPLVSSNISSNSDNTYWKYQE